jgi:hypothetical protein
MRSSLRAIWNVDLRWLGYLSIVGFLLGLTLVSIVSEASEEANTTTGSELKSALGLSGSARLGFFGRDKVYSLEQGYAPSSVWVTLKPDEWNSTRFFFDGYAQTDDFTRGRTIRLEAREAYVDRSFGALDIRVGRQIQVWGRADKINPTDQLTTRDMTRLFVEDEDQRLGLFSTQLTYNLGDYRLIAVWQPEWRNPVYPIPPLSGIRLSNEAPERPAEQIALKLDHTGGDLDYSLSYFNGFSRIPDFKVLAVGTSGIDLALDFRRVQVWGSDFAWNTGDFAWRTEFAYTSTANSRGSDLGAQNSNLFAVLGLDRTISEGMNINAQFLYRRVFDHVDYTRVSDPGLRLLAEQQDLVSNQLKADVFGLALRPSYLALNDTLSAETAVVLWFSSRASAIVRPKISYAVTDHWKVFIGSEHFVGAENTFFGRLTPLSTLFGELRYGF